MIHATRIAAGVALNELKAGAVDLALEQVDAGARARESARYHVTLQHEAIGAGERVRFIDGRGYVEALKLDQVVSWLAKYLSGDHLSVRISIDDASRLPATWTAKRAEALAAKFASVSPMEARAAAAAKLATVSEWADSGRKKAVTSAAARMVEGAAFVEWVRGEVEWPGLGLSLIHI